MCSALAHSQVQDHRWDSVVPPAPLTASRAVAPESDRVHILLAEDVGFDARDFRRKLRDWSVPHAISLVKDGEAAIDRLYNAVEGYAPLPNVVVLDLKLPKANGIQVLSFVRGCPELVHLPVVVWTTSDAPFDMSVADDLHVDAYMLKRDPAARIRRTLAGVLKL